MRKTGGTYKRIATVELIRNKKSYSIRGSYRSGERSKDKRRDRGRESNRAEVKDEE